MPGTWRRANVDTDDASAKAHPDEKDDEGARESNNAECARSAAQAASNRKTASRARNDREDDAAQRRAGQRAAFGAGKVTPQRQGDRRGEANPEAD
jgi:hypothetical protein